jgi:bacteriorhodopsin
VGGAGRRLSWLGRKQRSELELGYVALGVIYVVLLVVLGVKTARNGRWALFVIGFIFPLLWIIGGVLPQRGQSRVDRAYEQRGE